MWLFLLQNLFHALFLTCLSGFSFFKISLLMAKCQKSENFLSELQQAFLQAKRSVQEQMVRQVNSRDPCPALFVWPLELSVSVKGFVCPAKAGWRGLSIFTWPFVSFCAVLCVRAHSGVWSSLVNFFPPYSLSNSMPLQYLNFTSNLKTVNFLKTVFRIHHKYHD